MDEQDDIDAYSVDEAVIKPTPEELDILADLNELRLEALREAFASGSVDADGERKP